MTRPPIAHPVAHPIPPAGPLKPRRALFWVLLLVTLAWIGCLLLMYFKTVHGHPDRTLPGNPETAEQHAIRLT